VAFMGETLDIGVADLLSVLARRRQTGRLAINADGDEVFLYLKYGNLVGVTSSNHSLRLGRILMKLGLLDSARLEAAMRAQDTTSPPQPLGEILVKSGWVTPDDLVRAAEEQCTEALARVVIADSGTFMFSHDAPVPVQQGLVSLNTMGIVLEASRRVDEMTTLRRVLPALDVPLKIARAGVTGDLTDTEMQVVKALRGNKLSLGELGKKIPIDEISLWRALVSLRERGIVVADGEEESGGTAMLVEEDDPAPLRTVEEIVALCVDGKPVRGMPPLSAIRASDMASPETLGTVTLVAREVTAAFNAGLPMRAFSYFTDDYFRRQVKLSPDEIEALRAPGRPLAPYEQETIVTVRDVRVLKDGRVSAILVSRFPALGETRRIFVFLRENGRWQVDAVIEDPTAARTAGILARLRAPGAQPAPTSSLSADAELALKAS
jgi:uncharacterized membrane protein